MGFLEKIFGNLNEKEVNKLYKTVDKIEAFEESIKPLTDDELKAKTEEFKNRIAAGETLDDLLAEAYAVVREAAIRTLGMRHFRVQLLGGVVLHQGRIAEMKTGEGKTLMATLPVYLNALEGKGVHVITVNDYLAKRDKEWMGKIYEFLGLTVGNVIHEVKGKDRVAAYRCDITYGTNNEFGFDYLRDNMVVHQKEMVQVPLNYAIIDEVDSILVDEARTPLIISGDGSKSTNLYMVADMFVKSLKKADDVTIDEKANSVILTDESGMPKAEKYFNVENIADPENMEISHHINQAMKARYLMKRDVNYVVKDGEILIVDEFTGRLMQGRRYSNGLHQAIEAKEGLEVRKESQTLATITLQNYFRMYQKLAGMTGTAKTEEDEFRHIYNMDVVEVPTNKPIARDDQADSIYKSIEGKFRAVLVDIEACYEKKQPVLVGTISIETSEFISRLLKKKGIKHEVLNAKQHDREAEIVAQAGRYGAVTIATNMAGRGTDIVLGGNAEHMARRDMTKMGYSDEMIYSALSPFDMDDEEIMAAKAVYKDILEKHESVTKAEAEQVKAVGGLHIIGTERHESRRIDNQLRGRSGRQGDPGSSKFYISFEDDLMRLFVTDNIKEMISKMGMDDDMELEAKVLTRQIESAQKRVEGRNFGIRKHVLQYDDVMNKQREIIYSERGRVLHGDNVRDNLVGMVESIVDNSIELYTSNSPYPEEWDIKGMMEHLHGIYAPQDMVEIEVHENLEKADIKQSLMNASLSLYEAKEGEIGPEKMRDVERYILLKVVDRNWIDHIDAMDQMKQGIGLRAIGNEDPVKAYQIEGFDMFNEMTENIQRETVRAIYNVTVETNTERRQVATIKNTSSGGQAVQKKPVRKARKIGRNEPCPCGSGKKYKKCCGLNPAE